MNIEGANLSALLPNNNVTGTANNALKNESRKDFANTLKNQVKLSNEKSETEFHKHNPNKSLKNNVPHHAGSQKNKLTENPLSDLLSMDSPSSDKINDSPDLETTLASLNDALTSIIPVVDPTNLDTAQNSNDLFTFNGQTFFKSSSEEATLSDVDESAATTHALPKTSVLFQSLQNKQDLNLQALDAETSENSGGIEKMSLSGTENTPQTIAHDIAHKSVDHKTEFLAISKPLNHPGWSKELGEQIVWMNNKAIPTAEITMNPPHLGPISVRIDMNQDQATIMFTTQHAAVQEALEASIPKLREMLSDQQLNLVNVNVSHNTSGHERSQDSAPSSEHNEQTNEKMTDEVELSNRQAVTIKGLLSIYA